MEKVWKPNTTMNIPIDLLDRVAIFVKNTPEIKSRNILIEKSLNYFMDHWEDIRNKTSLVAQSSFLYFFIISIFKTSPKVKSFKGLA